ncbi:O-antigen ligase family protein [Ruminococcus sp. 5_1_39BFAA]|uniref:O-antigen ligase family protein n=1 Tax=Ruminococcus sp. 5_1_39BFAA TaxID=457412 RepID=UPI0035642DFB
MFNYKPKKRLKIRTIIVTLVIAATLVYIKSATALFAFVVYLLLVFLLQKKNNFLMKVISPSGIIIVFVVATLLVVVVDILPYISGITSVLFSGKDVVTGSSRIYVWKAAIEIIKNHFLFGIGETNFKTVVSVFSVTHPHNYFLFQWLSGGVGAVILSVLFFHSTLREMFKRKARFEYRLFIAATIVVFIMGVVESLTEFPLLYAIFVMGYNLNRIYPDENKRELLLQ